MAADRLPRPPSVLVTRPRAQAESLCLALQQAGYKAHSLPLLCVTALPSLPAAARGILLRFDAYQHVIFISGNAVRFGMDRLGDYWPQLPTGLKWYGIGAATATQLGDYGVTVEAPAGTDMTSEALLALPSLQHVAGQRVLVVKGEGGRGALRQQLLERGARVDELACYRRSRPQLPAGELARRLRQWQVQVIMISSGEVLANLQALLSARETTKFNYLDLIVPSTRVARMAGSAGFGQVLTAANASNAAMLQALERWHGSKRGPQRRQEIDE